jgi:site-specific DNA recombinase
MRFSSTPNDNVINAAAYIRVSTKRQAENELSLSEQENAISEYAKRNGMRIVMTFTDAGASGTSDNRPELQRLIQYSGSKPSPFSVVLIYNSSRFFRNTDKSAVYRAKLAKRNVRVVSVTQDFGEGAAAELAAHMVAGVDQYMSAINGEQVKLVMRKNAQEGYWNGSRAPFGYKVVVAREMKNKQKKKLEIDENDSTIVKRIFSLYLRGENGSGPMGLKAISSKLNGEGYKIKGKRFITSTISDILKKEVYIGKYYYNVRDSRANKIRPREEWIETSVPPIIEIDAFNAVQARLVSNRPTVTPPRRVNSPTLLAKIGKCGEPGCSAGLILMTGKGGKYRYLTCQTRRTASIEACSLKNHPMTDVDDIVISAIEREVLHPPRLHKLLSGLLERSDEALLERKKRLARLRMRVTEARGARSRLWDAVEAGLSDPRDIEVRDRIEARTREINSLEDEVRMIEEQDRGSSALERFASMVKEALRSEDQHLRKEYLHLLVSEVRLSNSGLVIKGAKNQLETVVARASESNGSLVPTFASDWRTRQDSNLRPTV